MKFSGTNKLDIMTQSDEKPSKKIQIQTKQKMMQLNKIAISQCTIQAISDVSVATVTDVIIWCSEQTLPTESMTDSNLSLGLFPRKQNFPWAILISILS